MGKRSASRRLLLAEAGFGPLIQRDYWGVVRNARASPRTVMANVRRHFPAFSPAELAGFERLGGEGEPLAVGDELLVRIHMAGGFRVRVIHADPQSLTLSTEEGHPEAGRITFGCYRNERGDLVFHIRSRARSSTGRYRTGFLAAGEVLQTSTWTDFVNRVAVAFGDGIVGFIHAETTPCADEPEHVARSEPTFAAVGG
ncbi:MAG TPA: hypothetical protein VN033_15365 [Vulgatibacter sp.]|nr:hypothetical protein [Vulgatibacter sp.]